jgi:hypothetical protein
MAGVSQPSPITAARQRARALAGAGDRPAAIALLEHAVGVGRASLGEDDPEVVAAAHQLAQVYLDVDDPSSARRILEEAYAAGQWRLGDADPLILEISYDLGVVAEELGNRHEARKALGRVAEAGRPVLGESHWAVVQARAYLEGDTGALRPPSQPGQPEPVVAPAPDRPPLKQRVPQQSVPPVSAPVTWAAPADLPAVVPPVAHPRLPDHQPPLPPVHRPAEQRLDAPAWPEQRPDAPARQEERLDAPAWQEQRPDAPARQEPREPAYGKRGPVVFAAIAAALASVIAVTALVFVLADRGADPQRPDVPTLGGGPPPTDVRVDDFGTSVTVSWTDPGAGKTSFIVSGGHPGEVLRSMGTVGPGQTRFTLQGLNDQLDYCFAVLAVYSTTEFASSPQSCTRRPEPDPTG